MKKLVSKLNARRALMVAAAAAANLMGQNAHAGTTGDAKRPTTPAAPSLLSGRFVSAPITTNRPDFFAQAYRSICINLSVSGDIYNLTKRSPYFRLKLA